MGELVAIVEEFGPTLLGLVLKLYPEIAALVSQAKSAGNLPTHIAAAVEAAMPQPGPAAVAEKQIEAMP